MIDIDVVTDLVKKYGAVQHPTELAYLLNFLKKNNKMETMVEVGVFRGGMIAVIKSAFPNLRVVGIDSLTVDSPEVSDEPSLRSNVEKFGITMVKGNSWDEATVQKGMGLIGVDKVDFIFIDASHDYDSVKKDYLAWAPHAHMVGFHDVHNPTGVYPFWDELILSQPYHSAGLWKETDGLGIGLYLP